MGYSYQELVLSEIFTALLAEKLYVGSEKVFEVEKCYRGLRTSNVFSTSLDNAVTERWNWKYSQILAVFALDSASNEPIQVKFDVEEYTAGLLSRAKFVPDRSSRVGIQELPKFQVWSKSRFYPRIRATVTDQSEIQHGKVYRGPLSCVMFGRDP